MSNDTNFGVQHVTSCRICGGGLTEYLDLGDQPPSNSFIGADQVAHEHAYPLKVALCKTCGLSQLTDVVSAADIFDDYLYLASTSKALCTHYAGLVTAALDRFSFEDGSMMVDIGCNDGIMLKGYPKDRFKLLGVEPSSAGAYARDAGFEVDASFFDKATGERLRESHGAASIITATNVFAHVDDIKSFAAGVQALLADDGVFISEFPYLGDMLEQCYFDTIYHEHLSYLSLTPLTRLFADFGLRAFRVEQTDVGASGPALRLFVCRADAPHQTDDSIAGMLADEQRWGVTEMPGYKAFAARVAAVKEELLALIKGLRENGHTVGAYCAPAKGNTLLNYLGLTADDISMVSDNNDLKIGKLTPGSHITVVNDQDFLDSDVSHALLLAWNYAEFFLANAEYVKQGGKFIIPLPEPVIRP